MPIPRTLRLLAALCLLLCCGGIASADSPADLTLTILHTNDVHGHVLPFAYTEIGRDAREQPSVGGVARRATLIRRLRGEITNPSILIDAGDTFTRGPLTNAYEGAVDTEAMNAAGYELAAIGNNEFKAKDGVDAGDAAGAQAALLQVVKRSRFPWVCANVTDERGAFLEGVQPYVVREFGGVRVGFLGLTAPRSASYPQTKGWKFVDPVVAAREWIPKARAHCDVLVAVTHLGTDLDRVLAAQTSGIDAIVGGDSHTFLYKAVEVANTDGMRVPIVQTGEFGVNLGRFDLHFERPAGGKWRLARYRYALLPVGPDLEEARDVAYAVAPYIRPMRAAVGRLGEVGATPEERTRNTTRVVVDAIRQAASADYAVNPAGGGFFEVFRDPAVTRYDVYNVMPFKNHIVVARMSGADLKALLAGSKMPVVSGPVERMEPAATYRVALVDFIARSVYRLPAGMLEETGKDMREAVIAFLAAKPVGWSPEIRSVITTARRPSAAAH